MKLWKFINYNDGTGFPVDIDASQYLPYILNNSSPGELYEDITSVTNIDKHWIETNVDYKAIRSLLQTVIENLGYANLSAPEKYLAAKWFAVDMALPLGDGTINFATFLQLANNWNIQSQAARTVRLNLAIAHVKGRLGKTNGNLIVDDVSSPVDLVGNYIKYGREGTESGDPEGLYDYINATVGTTWESNGLATKNFTPLDGTTLTDVITSIMSILITGN